MNVVFASGQTTATLDVPITNDMVLEEDEMFSATLMSQEPNVMVQDANSNADITIFDDDRKLFHQYRWKLSLSAVVISGLLYFSMWLTIQ